MLHGGFADDVYHASNITLVASTRNEALGGALTGGLLRRWKTNELATRGWCMCFRLPQSISEFVLNCISFITPSPPSLFLFMCHRRVLCCALDLCLISLNIFIFSHDIRVDPSSLWVDLHGNYTSCFASILCHYLPSALHLRAKLGIYRLQSNAHRSLCHFRLKRVAMQTAISFVGEVLALFRHVSLAISFVQRVAEIRALHNIRSQWQPQRLRRVFGGCVMSSVAGSCGGMYFAYACIR